MQAVNPFVLLVGSLMVISVQGSSERVIFTKLQRHFNLIPAVLDRPITIDCSVNSGNVKVSLYKKLTNGDKEIVKIDGKNVKRNGDKFEVVIRSYFESTDFYCHGEMYGTVYEKAVKVIIIGTSQEVAPTPEIFPTLSKVKVGEDVTIRCKCRGQLSTILWSKDRNRLTPSAPKLKIFNFFVAKKRESVSILKITNISRNDAGTYRCKASSSLEPGFFSYVDSKVEVREPKTLQWMDDVDDGNIMLVKKGSSATLDCSLSNSQSSVEFYRLGRFGRLYKIPFGSENTEFIGKQKLFIRRVSVSDMAVYVCKTVGIRNKRISLFLATDPKDVCQLFRPIGLRVLCLNKKNQFKQYITGLLRKMEDS